MPTFASDKALPDALANSGYVPSMGNRVFGNREKWSIGMAILGGVAALQGDVSHPVDVLLGAVINGGITYGIASAFISRKARKQVFKALSHGDSPSNNSKYRHLTNDVPNELSEFLEALVVPPGIADGWHRDPANLYLLRYLHKGQWTLIVSDSDSENAKKTALSNLLIAHEETQEEPSVESSSEELLKLGQVTRGNETEIHVLTRIERLERIGQLRRDGIISEAELNKLKAEILRDV